MCHVPSAPAQNRSRRFFIYEQYKDDAALEAHRSAPHFLQHAKKDLPKIAERVEGQLFDPLG